MCGVLEGGREGGREGREGGREGREGEGGREGGRGEGERVGGWVVKKSGSSSRRREGENVWAITVGST